MGFDKRCVIPTGVVSGVIAVIIIVLVSMSVRSVQENHVAIAFDNWSQSINTSMVYKPGVHAIGPTKVFIQYPTTYIQLSLTEQNSVVCRTKDGMLVSVPIQITYSYDSGQIIDLYQRFTDNFDEFLLNISSNTVRDTVNKYEAKDLQLRFENIKEELRVDLMNAYADIYLKFSNIDVTIPVLPADYQAMLANITSLNQEIEMQNNTLKQLEAVLKSDYELSKLDAEKKITEQSAAINVEVTQAISNYDYECTVSRQESISLRSLAEAMKTADESACTADDYVRLASNKNLNDILTSNTNANVLLGGYQALIG